MLKTEEKTSTLINGIEMPMLGVGTYRAAEGKEVQQAVHWALELGYRCVDTASVYENETGVGQAIGGSGIPREKLFLTSKLWNDDQGYDETLRAFDNSLQRLGTEYLDLYLVHWPVRAKTRGTWRAMEEIYDTGRAKAIGVSNFLQQDLLELLNHAKTKPAVNQIEFHPRLQQPELVDFCRQHDILVQAWSPLMKGEVFEIPELKKIGQQYGKSPGQIALRWQIQSGVATIPKSVKQEHLKSNAEIFDFFLSAEDMRTIRALDQNKRTGPDPHTFTEPGTESS